MDVLARLKEYKEIITLFTFFLGGYLWMQKEFPSKSYVDSKIESATSSISSLNCLLNKNISSLDAQLQIKIHTDNIERFTVKIGILSKKLESGLTEFELESRNNLIREVENEKDALKKEISRSSQALNSFKTGGCDNA